MMEILARRGLSIDRMRTFLAVVEAGGIARAAPQQVTRQSQMSRQLRELEEAMGVPLMVRRGRNLVPTPAGLELAGTLREAFRGLERIADRAVDAPQPIALGAGDSLLCWWLIPRLAELRAVLPRLVPRVLALSSDDIVERVQDGRLDVGVIRRAEVPGGLEAAPLGVVAHALYVPRALVPRRARTLAAIVDAVPLALQTSEPALNGPLLAGTDRAALWCETFTQAHRALETGAYAALLPVIAGRLLPRGRFRAMPVPRSEVRVALVWHPRLWRVRADGRALVERLTAALRLPALRA